MCCRITFPHISRDAFLVTLIFAIRNQALGCGVRGWEHGFAQHPALVAVTRSVLGCRYCTSTLDRWKQTQVTKKETSDKPGYGAGY